METIRLPGSKSISNRVLIIQLLSGLDFELENISDSNDTISLINAIQAINNGCATINADEAGTVMRFLSVYLAFQKNNSFILTGSERMNERPIKPLVDTLIQAGAVITYPNREGYPPLKITGSAPKKNKLEIESNISSQFISALMLNAPLFSEGITLQLVNKPVSFSYIKLTAHLMGEFGAEVSIKENSIAVTSLNYHYAKKNFYVESDWSAASYFYNALLIGKIDTIQLTGLKINSHQPDSVVAEIYEHFGIETVFENNNVVLRNNHIKNTSSFEYNFINCPDLAQTLAVTCYALGVPARLTGLSTLQWKETKRISALKNELRKLGAGIKANEEEITIIPHEGLNLTKEIQINTYNDHRMAMSFAPLTFVNPLIQLENKSVVNKSFPNFFTELKKVFTV